MLQKPAPDGLEHPVHISIEFDDPKAALAIRLKTANFLFKTSKRNNLILQLTKF